MSFRSPLAPLALALASLAACSSLAPAIPPWSLSEGMAQPESTYVDPGTGALFVSQVALKPGGSPMDKDGNGRISKLTVDGKLVKADWVAGLNSPKGLRSHQGTLWVSDVDEIVAIDIAGASVKARFPVEGAKFLNDVAIGPDGTVYVSDMVTSKIHQVKDGVVSVLAEGEMLEHPNGLLYENGGLIVAAWGKPEADMSTKVPGHLYRFDLRTRVKTLITQAPTGNLDGLESDGAGGYIVSDWMAGKVMQISGDGKVRLLRSFKTGSADIAYLPRSHTLIVPHMLENRVQAYDLRATMELPAGAAY